MLLEPLARKALNNTARTKILPAPVGGWNTRDPLDNMPANDAILLDNWFPREADVALREGYAEHVDGGEGASVVGLCAHESGTTSRLIAFSNGKALNVTSDPPSTLATGLNAAAEVFSFNFKGRSFHLNGVNAIQSYDSTTFASAALGKDGTETQTFSSAAQTFGMGYKNRLYFGGDGNLGFWYGTVNGVTGNMLFYFPLDGVLQKGGSLVAMGALTDDTGSGRADLACFLSSKGQIAIYDGSNPGDAAAWSLVGVYDIGEPLNRFGVVKFGADLIFITRDGYIPLTSILTGGADKSRRYALSDKISSQAIDVVTRYKANAGWRVVVVPRKSMLMVNIPRSSTAFDQHVMNTVTRSWCRFRSMPITSTAIWGGDLYFGSSDGVVYKYGDVTEDPTQGITGDAKTAWNYFDTPGRTKQFTQAQPVFASNASPLIQIGFGVDFADHVESGSIMASAAAGVGVWDEGIWDVAIWAGVEQTIRKWIGLVGLGYAGSFRVRAAESDATLAWKSTRVIFQPGGPR